MTIRADATRGEHQVHARTAANVNDGRAWCQRADPKRICNARKRGGRLGWECGEHAGVVSEPLGGIVWTTMTVEFARGVRGDSRVYRLNLVPKFDGVEIDRNKRSPFWFTLPLPTSRNSAPTTSTSIVASAFR